MPGRRAQVGLVALLASCAPEAAPSPQLAARPVAPVESDASRLPEPPPQYVVGDPLRGSSLTVLPVGDDAAGVTLEGLRFVVRGSQVHVARDASDPPLQAGWRVPARLGGGFLFRGRGALYASESFDGLLRPVVNVPSDIASVSFGPKAALLRAESGERWMIEPATGKRVPIEPAGLLAVAALDDGRAAALVDGGRLLVSTDGGGRWTDATVRLHGAATRVRADRSPTLRTESLWVETEAGTLGLLPGGRLADYDSAPPADPAPLLRAKQPAWREDEAPIRRAIRSGAPARDGTALLVSSGDVVQVDLVSGTVEVIAPGKLPPDATCVGTRAPDGVLFTCAHPRGGTFVVAHALEHAPVIERTFSDAGRFVVSDDGGVLWSGPCDKPAPSNHGIACVRLPGGAGWQQLELEGGGGVPGGPTYNVVRWIPGADGSAIAVVSDVGGVASAWGLVDARSKELHAWPNDAMTPALRAALQGMEASRSAGDQAAARLADRSWTVTPQGTLRGWAMLGGAVGAVEVGADGSLQTSPFTFERIASAGAIALTRTREGRIWQTLDRGATWSEVAGPPAARPGAWIDPHACSLVGCDLGQWYRIGWVPTPPTIQPAATTAPPAPRVERAPVPALVCRPAGDAKSAQAVRGDRSPDDLGLGASKVAVSDGKGVLDFVRVAFPRRILGPVRDTEAADDAAPRVIVHGPATQPGDGTFVVSGFRREPMALVRQVSFVPAFDPLGVLRKAPVAMRDLVGAARAMAIAQEDILRDDPMPSAAVPATPADPAAPGDLLVQIADGGIALLRGSAHAGTTSRFAYEAGRTDEWRIVSGVALDGDGFAWLEEDGAGRARAVRATQGSRTTAFEVDPPPSADLYPADVDALAVGPRGELALLRMPSGSEPASPFDPALLVVPGTQPVPLAPWSTLAPAEDAACRNDPSGWRATIQTALPWLRLSGAGELAGVDDAPMLARVRWSTTRVCLEAVELRTQDYGATAAASPSAAPWGAPAESWAVARFAGAVAAGRVVVVAGGELRQPLECNLQP
jgi:hypothetical protein